MDTATQRFPRRTLRDYDEAPDVQLAPQLDLYNDVERVDVIGCEVVLCVSVGPSIGHDSYVCELLVSYDVNVGTPNVEEILGVYDDESRPVPASGIPAYVAEWVRSSHVVVDAAEDAWAAHVQDARDYAVESGYCGTRGM